MRRHHDPVHWPQHKEEPQSQYRWPLPDTIAWVAFGLIALTIARSCM